MNIELSGKQMLQLTAISSETGSSIESIIKGAVQSFLNKCPLSSVPLNDKESVADQLGNMVGTESRRRAGIK
jgi:hypothetical protein